MRETTNEGQETCPLDTANLVATAHAVDQDHEDSKVEFLTITIDPERDTPAQLAAYRRQYAPTPINWQALTGTPADIAKLWKYLGVWYQKAPEGSPPAKNWRTGQPLTYDLNHADEIFFVDGHGDERFVLNGAAHVAPGTTLPPAMHKFRDADGLRNLQAPPGQFMDRAGHTANSQLATATQAQAGAGHGLTATPRSRRVARGVEGGKGEQSGGPITCSGPRRSGGCAGAAMESWRAEPPR
ncbi:SCO family protein [Streptomyces silvisoli]|uniref:SCO family protein n=1 Tax=Streptomyces silvisoli TaxID=3034235 RepID=A0ABT5ZQ30_9ACTN|nr:SCO family protein [Streptomyces silvisoli]MDF3291934.1 SCO family protein [Streptomyces silvisoli]